MLSALNSPRGGDCSRACWIWRGRSGYSEGCDAGRRVAPLRCAVGATVLGGHNCRGCWWISSTCLLPRCATANQVRQASAAVQSLVVVSRVPFFVGVSCYKCGIIFGPLFSFDFLIFACRHGFVYGGSGGRCEQSGESAETGTGVPGPIGHRPLHHLLGLQSSVRRRIVNAHIQTPPALLTEPSWPTGLIAASAFQADFGINSVPLRPSVQTSICCRCRDHQLLPQPISTQADSTASKHEQVLVHFLVYVLS
ncbi:uncharacterized protein LOC129348932 [Amphiprion ocellaris]|uniref:uncharacterized protein LOC129348932 n=1 Tax=Amphiprion ocellaris TaxID=80972 RepID=UPI00241122CB|nr:uncharacterized protein LOC129348932 [Amphiprion ocellaris]